MHYDDYTFSIWAGMYFLLNSELDTDMEKMEKEPGNINYSMYTSKFN